MKIALGKSTSAIPALFLPCLLLMSLASACAPISLNSLADNLNRQNDLELVCDGAPSFLLLIDSLIANDPEDEDLLLNGIKAYTSYATAVSECERPERSHALSAKAHTYGLTLLRLSTGIAPGMDLSELNNKLHETRASDLAPIFWGAYGWALWIADQQGAPSALADLPRVEKLMRRVIELDGNYYQGGAHLFLGVYYGSKPVMYGGKPELSREHFEQALAINKRKFLPVQVAFAENYARRQLDRELYQRLLEEVLAFDLATEPSLTLSNIVAQRRARRLLAEIDDYF